MDYAFTEEQDATGELATRILTERSTHERLREIERSGEVRFDRDLWATLAESGLLGIALPESVGGAGLGLIELARMLEAVGRTDAAVPLWETLGLGALPIAAFGSEDARSTWLAGVASGATVLTAAWHEDGGDPLVPVATAKQSDAGWSVSGVKSCVPAGQIADGLVVPALADGSPALFVVAVGEGVEVTPLATTSGSPDARLTFTNAPATLLASGADAVAWAFERAVATQCAVSLGNAEAMLDLLAAYTKERKQFDVPIATFQAVGHRAADSYIDTEAIRLTCWQALSRLADGLPATAEVSVAKFWSAWAGQRITLAAAHLHGGVGVDRDYPLARHYTKAKELELQLGGATQHLARIGDVIAA
jgi:alkylation response protein AidB-like acyl-CoA dehydrogenase